MQQFEIVKRDFGLEELVIADHEIVLDMEGVEESENYDGQEAKVKFSNEVLESWFRPVVQKILAMLEEQMRRSRSPSGQAINVSEVVAHG